MHIFSCRVQPILESLFDRSRSHYLQSRYGTHQPECEPGEDEMCKFATRAGLYVSSSSSSTDPDVTPFPFAGAHPTLVHEFQEAIATTPPPNDPILMRGPLHLIVPSPGGIGGERNGTGFGVSAERSGCQTDPYLPIGGGGGMGMGMGMQSGFGHGLGQNLKWLSQEYSDSGWMTWY